MDRWILEPIEDSFDCNLVHIDKGICIRVQGPVFLDFVNDLARKYDD